MNTDDTDRKSGDLVIAKPEGLPRIYADGRGSEQVKTSPRINTDGTDQRIGHWCIRDMDDRKSKNPALNFVRPFVPNVDLKNE